MMPTSECSGSGAEFTLPLSPSLEPDVRISEATLVNVAEDSLLGSKEAAEDVSENVTESGSGYEAFSEVSPSDGIANDVLVVPVFEPTSECSGSGAEFTLPLSPSLDPDDTISEATSVNVAEYSLFGYKEAAYDISENGAESGNEASSETFS